MEDDENTGNAGGDTEADAPASKPQLTVVSRETKPPNKQLKPHFTKRHPGFAKGNTDWKRGVRGPLEGFDRDLAKVQRALRLKKIRATDANATVQVIRTRMDLWGLLQQNQEVTGLQEQVAELGVVMSGLIAGRTS